MTEEKKQGYTGSYDGEIKRLYELIAGREGFKYEPSADPVYRAYRDSYEKQGKMAMRDSIAQSAHLTGGYGSSYGQSLGQQQYGSYLEKLGALMPELYSAALERYRTEGDSLSAQLSAAKAMDNVEYQRYSDERDRQSEQEQFDYKKQNDAFKNLMDIITGSGYEPTAEELKASGMSAEQAAAMSYEFKRAHGLLPRASSGGGSRTADPWVPYADEAEEEKQTASNELGTLHLKFNNRK